VREADRKYILDIAKRLIDLDFSLVATRGTARLLTDAGLQCDSVNKVREGRPHIVDMIKNDEVNLIVNTTDGKKAINDSYEIRREALQGKVTYTTTITGAWALCEAMAFKDKEQVYSLQDLHQGLNKAS
jgi:carbamoyl-phosphate synthase large subunit